jgi:hypothetical protein
MRTAFAAAFVALAVVAMLVALAIPALAEPPPKIRPHNITAPPALYLGKWCGKPNPDEDRIVYRSFCTFASIRLTGEFWPRSTKPAREDWVPTIAIRCRETGKRLLLEWVKGDQIDVTR